MDSTKRALRGWAALGMKLVPKHHLMVHWALRARSQGNPDLWATYEDEHTNGVLAAVARRAHAMVWSKRVHLEFPSAVGARAPFAKRART